MTTRSTGDTAIPSTAKTSTSSSSSSSSSSAASGSAVEPSWDQITEYAEIIASGSQIDWDEYSAEMSELYADVAEMEFQNAVNLVNFNMSNFPNVSQAALDTTMEAGAAINDAMAQAFYDSLDSLSPTWKEDILGTATASTKDVTRISKEVTDKLYPELVEPAMALYKQGSSSVAEMLSGQVPQDVYDYLAQSQAETMQAFGITGTSAGSAGAASLANQLGLLSLDVMNMGYQNLASLNDLGNTIMGYGTTAVNAAAAPLTAAANLGNITKGFLPSQVDYGSLYTTALGQITGVGTINPSMAYSSTGSILSSATNIATSNASSSSDAYTSAMNYTSDIYGANLTLAGSESLADATESAGTASMWGSIIGGLL